jgi:AAA+ superfamily predicted ATPase
VSVAAGRPVEVPPSYDGELAWLDRVIELEILRLRARYELSLDEFRGLYISDRHVDELLRQQAAAPTPPPTEYLTAQAAAAYAARPRGTPLTAVENRFGLTRVESDLLLLALAPEIALKYETLYAYLNNDITRKHVTVDLAVRLLGNIAPASAVREALRSTARLFHSSLLEWIDAGGDRRSLRAQGFSLAVPVTEYLLGLSPVDARLPSTVECSAPTDPVDGSGLWEGALTVVRQFTATHPPNGLSICVADSSAEQRAAVQIYAATHGHGVIAIPLSTAFGDASGWPTLRTRAALSARLLPAVVLLYEDLEGLVRDPHHHSHYVRIIRDLAAERIPICVGVLRDSPWSLAVGEIPFTELSLPPLDAEDRSAAWRASLQSHGVAPTADLVEELGRHFVLSYARITAAAATAARACTGPDTNDDRLRDALWHAARRHSSQSLGQLTTRVCKPHRWEHLVLPDATLARVRDVASAVRQRVRVFQTWRMAERTGRGYGLMILFAGASGTGKTMTAAVIANDLRLELFRIDLASVVSKYIGETEKNLDRIFEAARRSNGILFFDEADALLGKRSEVKDAHDRYANIEIAYLLQKMEEHDGVVILATNLAKNLDQAFARRMHYAVEFPRPGAGLRERLWRGMFPRETPLADDLDFHFLAEQFDTSGGEIQMVALDAAFLASAEDRPIRMAHVVQAMARLQLKQGNPVGISSFKQYYDVLRVG